MITHAVADVLAGLHREETARKAHHDAEAALSRGVCISGMGPGPFQARSDVELDALARINAARIESFRASPRGRLLRALKDIAEVGSYAGEAEAVRAIYSRSLADVREAPCPRAIGRAIHILADIPNGDARRAVLALAELLMAERKAA